jgi:hypothetical protein
MLHVMGQLDEHTCLVFWSAVLVILEILLCQHMSCTHLWRTSNRGHIHDTGVACRSTMKQSKQISAVWG